jgi:hypothetical protein
LSLVVFVLRARSQGKKLSLLRHEFLVYSH